jgi:signal transduction histidine kinase
MQVATSRPIVWVLDDSPLEAEVTRRALTPGYAVEVFADGAAMLERVAQGQRPDTLVLDWYMPSLSGREVCAFVRQTFDQSSLPIVILTSTDAHEDLLAGLSAGANDFIKKPFHADELRARVAGLVERRRLNDLYQREAALRERFIGILGHDLRQPLNTFVIGTAALLNGSLAEGQAKTVGRLAGAARRMQRMISDLLDLTQSRVGGGIPIVRRELDLSDPCLRVVEELRMGHPGRSLELTFSGGTEGSYDRDRIMQMCTNLIANALEHGSPSCPIVVSLTGSEEDVLLAVENQGPPIPASQLPSLFDPFRRGAVTSGAKGLGLGLFIVEQIALGHGGSVSVESDEAKTRFVVTLPREAARRTLPPSQRLPAGP